ncbi:hypothetical protein GF389_00960 [Candidatus Dojkabacteria bacterium]|nr:hypothetical protein [Candidatus Dojkabacteria bacterium]
MKIVTLVTNADFEPEDIERLKKYGEFDNTSVKKLTDDEIVERAKDAEVIAMGSSGVEFFSREALERLPKLRYITIMGVATDPLDLEAATELGIKVSHYVGVNSQSVAEHTWGMILSLSKQVTEAHIEVKNGETSFMPFSGRQLQGKTIGIMGWGEIGSRVGYIAKGFDMKVLAFNRSEKQEDGVEFVGFETLLKESDVIVCAVPHTDETEGMIGEKQYEMMKEDVIFVNPSREKIVDVDATLAALESGKLFGFGMELDINNSPDERFYKYPNVVITPHNGFFTVESEALAAKTTIDNMIAFIEGNPQNLVN